MLAKEHVVALKAGERSYNDLLKATAMRQTDGTATVVIQEDGTQAVLVRMAGRFKELPVEAVIDLRDAR